MASVLESSWTSFLGCLLPLRQNTGGNEERHHRGLSNIANGFMTRLYNGVSYLTQSLGYTSQNQLQLESEEFESLDSNGDISEVTDPLHLANVVEISSIEKGYSSIQPFGQMIDSGIGSHNSGEEVRNSRASQAQHPAQSKRLRSCNRAEPQGKRMCIPTGMCREEKEDEEKEDEEKK